MRITDKKFIIVLLIGLLLLGIGQVVWAEKWEPNGLLTRKIETGDGSLFLFTPSGML